MKMLIALLAFGTLLEAKDFGVKGPLFAIEEENLETHFQNTCAESAEKVLSEIREKIEHPDSLGLPPAVEASSHLVDLPGLGVKMLFIDGDDPNQVAWAQEQGDDFLWILVGGTPTDLEEKLGREIFFDQMGLYTKRLKIKEIPAKAVPEEGQIRVIQTPVKR